MPAPPTYSTIAHAFAATRAATSSTSQLFILDLAIDYVADGLYDINPRFDAHRFKTMCQYRFDYIEPIER